MSQTIAGDYGPVSAGSTTSLTEGYNLVPQLGGTQPDLLTLEVYDSLGMELPAPRSVNLAAAVCGSSGTAACTFGTCFDCVQLYQDVDFTAGTVGKLFFATSGSVNINKETLIANNPDGGLVGGQLRARGQTIHLVEWTYNSTSMVDMATPGGACIDVTTVTWDAGW
jgi:hypothetical protein